MYLEFVFFNFPPSSLFLSQMKYDKWIRNKKSMMGIMISTYVSAMKYNPGFFEILIEKREDRASYTRYNIANRESVSISRRLKIRAVFELSFSIYPFERGTSR